MSLDTDRFMRNLWTQLHTDFRRCTGSVTDHPLKKFLDDRDIPGFRTRQLPSLWKDASLSYTYKWEYQLQNLFKRYRFKDDLYTDDELDTLTNEKFLQHQQVLAAPRPTLYDKQTTRLVVMKARKIMRRLLGKYSYTEHIEQCSFGTKSTVGCPLHLSYYDVKAKSLSGSLRHQSDFDGVIREDNILAAATKGALRTRTERLKQVNVPKSYKIFRGITPNTTIGAFLTKGLGIVFEDRCKSAGLSIRATQARHRRYVRRFSKTRTHVTADLSNASNSFTVALLCALLPREWFRVCMNGRVGHLEIDGKTFKLESVMTMGIGFTFPLQTLLFYAILKSIAELLSVKGLISVYGDDLIFPREMYTEMQVVFNALGFSLNTDKSFCYTHFRESCGADFFNGIDVRPFNPEGTSRKLRGFSACAFLYKMLNGLRKRWTYAETQATTSFILRTILQHTPEIHQVPPSFPDSSGVKVSKPIDSIYFARVEAPYNRCIRIRCVERGKNFRAVENQWIYLWNALRTTSKRPLGCIPNSALLERPQSIHYLVPIGGNRFLSRRYLGARLADYIHASLGEYGKLVGKEGMQIVWQKRRPVVEKGVKRVKLKPVETSRKAARYELRKADIPMWE